MSLEGLRAWIGEVERKLTMRTRVFLVLAVIAVGLGGAAIYLAVDARESSVSESDVRALQERLEAQIGTGGGATPAAATARLEAQLKALRAEVAELQGGTGKSQGKGAGKGSSAGETGGSSGAAGGASAGSANGASSGGSGGASRSEAASKARLQELLERTKQQNAQAEAQQNGAQAGE